MNKPKQKSEIKFGKKELKKEKKLQQKLNESEGKEKK